MKMTNLPPMTKYVRTLPVQAARITGWADTGRGATLSLEGGLTVDVSRTFMRMFHPKIGDYFVVSENSNVRAAPAERFHHDYQPAPNPLPIAWPEIERLASMRPQAEVVKRMPPPVERGGQTFGTRAQMDVVLGRGVGK